MRWVVLSALAGVIACDISGVNRENLLYLHAQSFVIGGCLAALVACYAWSGFCRRTKTVEKGGRLFVLRNTDKPRWILLGVGGALLVGLLSVFFFIYTLEVSLNYIAKMPFSMTSRIVQTWRAVKSPRPCDRYVVVALENAESRPICAVKRSNRDSPVKDVKKIHVGEFVSLHGRQNVLGIVVDRIDYQ